jgi:hypothetical protein
MMNARYVAIAALFAYAIAGSSCWAGPKEDAARNAAYKKQQELNKRRQQIQNEINNDNKMHADPK